MQRNITDKDYVIEAMTLAVGALRTMPCEDTSIGLIIRQLEVSIKKLREQE